MIFGTGTDIIEISRINNLMQKYDFLHRYFTEQEIAYIDNKPDSAAAYFAAKEAYSKALGTGVRGFSLKDIEILHDDLGKPYIKSYNNAYVTGSNIFLSLSHCKEYATAFVVIELTVR